MFVCHCEQSGFYTRFYPHDFEFIFFTSCFNIMLQNRKIKNSGLYEWSFYYLKRGWLLREYKKYNFSSFFFQYVQYVRLLLFIYLSSHWDLNLFWNFCTISVSNWNETSLRERKVISSIYHHREWYRSNPLDEIRSIK